MLIVRPAESADLDQLEQLALLAGVGLTTLPADRKFLGKRLRASQAAFANLAETLEQPADETFLFVLEDIESKSLLGVSGLFSKVGGFEPFYAYRIESEVFESKYLKIRHEVRQLKLHEDHNGPTEIGSLFLHPDHRRGGSGRFLQLVRFLFMAEHPGRFESSIISEIRGVVDTAGNSPFWDAVGRHFFGIDFRQADHLSAVNKRFIAELMPDHPIYIAMLPGSARDVIGVAHEQSRRAISNLEAEGFRFANMVDIFDAGPILSCPRDDIRTIRASRRGVVLHSSGTTLDAPSYIVCTTGPRFRAVVTPLRIEAEVKITMPSQAISALGISTGDTVRYAPVQPG
jgi:arginine N-succinyltransferase